MRALLRTTSAPAPAIARVALALILFPHGAQHVLGWFGGYGFAGTLAWMTGTLGFPAPLAVLVLEDGSGDHFTIVVARHDIVAVEARDLLQPWQHAPLDALPQSLDVVEGRLVLHAVAPDHGVHGSSVRGDVEKQETGQAEACSAGFAIRSPRRLGDHLDGCTGVHGF
jgi:hypothetical protein